MKINLKLSGAITKSSYFSRHIAPIFLSICVGISGLVLLISGALPLEIQSLFFAKKTIGLQIFEFSHFITSILGGMLIILGVALRDKNIFAYYITCGFLALALVTSLISGGNLLALGFLFFVFLSFIGSKKYFYRRASILDLKYKKQTCILGVFALGTCLIIGLLVYQNTSYSESLWWTFSWSGDASRFLRSLLGISIVFLFFIGAQFFRFIKTDILRPSNEDLESYKTLIDSSPNASSALIYIKDKYILENTSLSGIVMYGLHGKSAISMGEPLGNQKAL